MNVRTWWTVGCLVGLLPCKAAGQICSGFAPFTEGRMQASGSAAFNNDAKSFGGGFSFGGVWPFGQVSISTTSYDDLDGSSLNTSVGGGFQFKLDSKGTVYMCPTAAVAFAVGPDDVDVFGDGNVFVDLAETDFIFTVSIGVIAAQSDQTRVIPTASLGFVSATLTAENQVTGLSDSATDSFGILGLAIGFIINRVVTLHPGVSIPLGLEGAPVSFGATISINFGSPAQ